MNNTAGKALNVLVKQGMFLCCIQQAILGFFVIFLSPSRLMLQYYFTSIHTLANLLFPHHLTHILEDSYI
jgi:hypothetical protein